MDEAVRDVHPEYSGRILDRMHELEAMTRENANTALIFFDQRRQALMKTAEGAIDQLEKACQRCAECEDQLARAAQRHAVDGAGLRAELGELKRMLDAQSLRLRERADEVEEMLEQAAARAATAVPPFALGVGEPDLGVAGETAADMGRGSGWGGDRGRRFVSEQRRLLARSRSVGSAHSEEDLAELVREAQLLATSRSPSSSREQGATRRVSSSDAWRGGRRPPL